MMAPEVYLEKEDSIDGPLCNELANLVEVGKSRIKLLSNNFRLNLFLSQNLVLQHTHILCRVH